MGDDLENALAWFQAAPSRWMASAKKDLSAGAEWIWGVIQGDFNEEASTSQTIVSTVISMIPLVDQICDVRDVVANCKKLHEDTSKVAVWVALALTLIGLFPTLGSLVKGCGKILFGYARRSALRTGEKLLGKIDKDVLEAAIAKLNAFLQRPEVRKTLKALDIDNIYKYLATKLRLLKGQVAVGKLLSAFDDARGALNSFLDIVKRYGGEAMGHRADQLLELVGGIRSKANEGLGKAVKPVQDVLDQLARRLEVEADNNYRAYLKVTNPHGFIRPTQDAELAAFKKDKPKWVKETDSLKYRPMKETDVTEKAGWPDLASKDGPLKDSYATFHHADPVEYPPGTVLYRIVDPKSADNSICWMTKEEFDKLANKEEWREKFAVWQNWNSNGEFVTYKVPPGRPLRAWEGETASQTMRSTNYVAQGGARQIVLNPADLDKSFIGKREPTGWGYGDGSSTAALTGVPVLTNNWFTK